MSNNFEKDQQKKFRIEAKKAGILSIKYIKYTYAKFIIRFEKYCFDWHYLGIDRDDYYEGASISDSGRITHKHKIIKYARFERPKNYQKNFLFSFTELLSNIVSFFRRLSISLIWLPIVGLILSCFLESSNNLLIDLVTAYFGIMAGLIVASIVLALLGKLWIKVFKLQEKTNEMLERHGYVAWDEDIKATENHENFY